MSLRLWTCTTHDYVWPVGVASVVMARDEDRARELLDAELRKIGLKDSVERPYELVEVFFMPQAIILQDGDY